MNKKIRSVGIFGAGSYVPEKILTNKELEQTVDTTDEWITTKIGIKERRIAKPGELASDMGAYALQDACSNAGITTEEIDLIICGSNTPDYNSPQMAALIAKKLGINHAVTIDARTGGCPGGVFSVDIAAQYVATGRYDTVAVVNAELNSAILDWEDRSTCVIMGDGAGCLLLRPCKSDTGIIHTVLHNDPSGYFVAYVPSGGTAMPTTEDTLQKKLGYFHMDGRAIWNFATVEIPELIKELSRDSGISLSDVDLFISHQANLNIIKEIMHKINVPMSKTFTNIEKYGNTSSASVLIAISEALKENRIKHGDLIFTFAFGAGLSYGATAIKWCAKEDFLLSK
ncbi:3-oxoacyl-ACP synthase III family protein [Priestia koreensis]|uniref:3-oxoacyl-ACP synthase III family protein n=1 Tax=Priestia koreensis TaxID=284581 RepID=UPI001F572B94|nr:beta-ketoacyl-ACP synthase III [Priestia koreensis]UNL86788.1 ketoacyl-ACP synthase III [Priestia koreensis]